MAMNKRSELANILRQLADYIDRQSDDELAPLFQQASRLMHGATIRKKTEGGNKLAMGTESLHQIAQQLQELDTRNSGEVLLKEKIANRETLESLARFLQLPVQRDDTIERLRAKIVENTIGSRLRSDAIQGKD
jgi:lipopolysaccharide biosynthesis regulator YciM